jgi:hypothetical protein
MIKPEQSAKWYPSSNQLKDPQSTERSFRNLLDMFYQLQDSHAALQSHVKQNGAGGAGNGAVGASKEAVPAGNSASITRVLGLPVEPSDTTQLADGTVLTYVAATRSFKFQ